MVTSLFIRCAVTLETQRRGEWYRLTGLAGLSRGRQPGFLLRVFLYSVDSKSHYRIQIHILCKGFTVRFSLPLECWCQGDIKNQR